LFIYLVVNVSDVPRGTLPLSVDPEYTYSLYKTLVVHKDPIQTTQYKATVSCYFYQFQPIYQSNTLYCLLRNIHIFTTVTVDNIITEITNEQLNTSDWFQIKFNHHGVEQILVNKDTNKKDFIKDIANLFDIGNDLTNKMPILYRSIFIAAEKTVIGTCSTKYNISVSYEEQKINKENKENKLHIILSEMIKHMDNWINKTNLCVLIEKTRSHCFSWEFNQTFPGIEVVHTYFLIYVLYFLLSSS